MDLGKEFEKFFQDQLNGATKEFESNGAVMHSTIVLSMVDGKLSRGMIVMPEEVINNRDLYYALIKDLVQQTRAIAVCMVSEAWIGGSKDLRPSEDPNRQEAVIVNATRYNPLGAVIDNKIVHLLIDRDVEPAVLLSRKESLERLGWTETGEAEYQSRLADDTSSGPDYFGA
jgi:hypothetical protein